jgi:hypothetical protein
MRLLLFALLAAGSLAAQSLRIYSELQRIGPFGEVVRADRNARPREILSPMVARNAHASFHVAVSVPPHVPAYFYFQQNPERLEASVYREVFRRGIPDALEPVSLPSLVLLPEDASVQGQTTVVFWLDLWVPAGTPVGRMRCDALLGIGSEWFVAPMEVRIMPGVVSAPRRANGRFPPVTAPADAFACSTGQEIAPELSIRRFIRRDALQDEALAGHSLCKDGARLPELGPEWYLRARDAVLRGVTY